MGGDAIEGNHHHENDENDGEDTAVFEEAELLRQFHSDTARTDDTEKEAARTFPSSMSSV